MQHDPLTQLPPLQSESELHVWPSLHPDGQVPPHSLPKAGPVQHDPLTQLPPLQSESELHVWPSLHPDGQVPPHSLPNAGPVQHDPLTQLPPLQSESELHVWPSLHPYGQVPPHSLANAGPVQHDPLTQLPPLQSESELHVWPSLHPDGQVPPHSLPNAGPVQHDPLTQLPPLQSESELHVWPSLHPDGQVPPHSLPNASPVQQKPPTQLPPVQSESPVHGSPSLPWQIPALHTPLAQSVPSTHELPSAQVELHAGRQILPVHTSVTSQALTQMQNSPSAQELVSLLGSHPTAAAGEGSMRQISPATRGSRAITRASCTVRPPRRWLALPIIVRTVVARELCCVIVNSFVPQEVRPASPKPKAQSNAVWRSILLSRLASIYPWCQRPKEDVKAPPRRATKTSNGTCTVTVS